MFLCTAFSANATRQFSNRLIIDDFEYNVDFFPLKSFFDENPKKAESFNHSSTALRRGYIATFEFINNQLYVVDLHVLQYNEYKIDCYPFEEISVFHKVFPNSKKVKIDWPTAVLVIPLGQPTKNDYEKGIEEYANYLILEICDGVLETKNNYKLVDFKKFMKDQYELFQKTTEYSDILEYYIGYYFTKETFDEYFETRIFDEFINEIQYN